MEGCSPAPCSHDEKHLELANGCFSSAQTVPVMTHQMATPISEVCFMMAVKVPFPIQRGHTHMWRYGRELEH